VMCRWTIWHLGPIWGDGIPAYCGTCKCRSKYTSSFQNQCTNGKTSCGRLISRIQKRSVVLSYYCYSHT